MQIIFDVFLHYCPFNASILYLLCNLQPVFINSFVVVDFEQKVSEVIFFLMVFSVSFLCRSVRSSDIDALSLFSFLELLLTVFMLPQLESLVADLLCCASFFGRKIDSPVSFCIFWCHHHSWI